MAAKRRRARRATPARPRPVPRVRAVEERILPLAREVARIAGSASTPPARLEAALAVLCDAFGTSDEKLPALLLDGWLRGRRDKRVRLAMAWLREQLRLSIEEILEDGMAAGTFRRDLDPVAFSAICLGAAEGCLLQPPSQGGIVSPDELVKLLVRLAAAGA